MTLKPYTASTIIDRAALIDRIGKDRAQGFSIVLFETEEQAREAVPPASSWAAPGIAITGVEFRRVAATA